MKHACVHRDFHHVASIDVIRYSHVGGVRRSSRKGTRLCAHVQSRTRTRLAFETLNHGGIRDSVDEEIGESRVSITINTLAVQSRDAPEEGKGKRVLGKKKKEKSKRGEEKMQCRSVIGTLHGTGISWRDGNFRVIGPLSRNGDSSRNARRDRDSHV